MPDLRRSHGCSARNRSHHRKSRAGDEPGSSCSDNCQRGGPASIALRPWLPAGWRCQDHFRHRRIRADGDWTRIFRSPEQGLLPTVAWQLEGCRAVHALDGGVYCAGSAIEWAHGLRLFEDYSSLDTFDKPAAIDRNLVFVPALIGLACPHWDRVPQVCGSGCPWTPISRT